MSPPGADDDMVAARTALLDALDALESHLDALILVGAQAIYLWTGGADLALAESTDDSDLAIDHRLLGDDPLLEKAIEIVVQTQTASVSLIQRRLRVGYTRAGRLIDMLERRGIISGYEGSKPRRVLVGEAELERFVAAL